jgi:hypothetical protein
MPKRVFIKIRVQVKDKKRPDSPWSAYTYFAISGNQKPKAPVIPKVNQDYKLVFYSPVIKPDTVIKLKWEKQKDARSYHVEVKDRDGKKVIDDYTPDGEYDWNPEAFGTYEWSVKTVDHSGVESEPVIGKVNLKYDDSFNPDNGGTKIQLKKPNQMVDFEWDGTVKGKEKFLFEVAEDPNFDNIRIKRKTTDNQVKFKFPKTGTFYWRTKKVLPNGKVEFSQPIRVQVEPTPPPKKLQIEEELKLEIEVKKDKTTSVWDYIIQNAWADVEFVMIKWPAPEEMKGYVLEIYQDAEMSKRIIKAEVEKPEYEWDNPRAGTYYWRVQQIDFWDQKSEFSNLSKVTIVVPDSLLMHKVPELVSPEDGDEILSKFKNYTFKWTETDNAKDYVLEISKDKNFSSMIVKKETKSTMAKVTKDIFAKVSEVYWRVQAHGSYQQNLVSEANSFRLKEKKVIPVPVPVKKVEPPKPKPKPAKKAKPVLRAGRKIHPRYLRFYDYLTLGWAPTNIGNNIDDKQFNGEVTGMAMNSLMVKGRYLRRRKSFWDYRVVKQSGSVFDGQGAWNNSEVQFMFANPYKHGETKFLGKYGLQVNHFSNMVIETNTYLVDETNLYFSFLGEAEFEWGNRKNFGHHFSIGAAIGQVMKFYTDYEMRLYAFKNFIINGGARLGYTTINTDTGTNTLLEQQLYMGMTFYFAPKWEEFINLDFWSDTGISKPQIRKKTRNQGR